MKSQPPASGTSPSGPLAGVKVIDLTSVLMGPLASQHLGDLGADVIKVEAPDGDSGRKVGPGAEQGMGVFFLNTNRNKRSIVLDLKKPSAREVFLRLVETADVVVCNVRPQGMKRLRLAYEDLAQVNPRIIYISMIGFSQRGRYAAAPAFDDVIQAATGLPSAMAANIDGEPRYVPLNIADRSVGLYGFGVIAAALYAREKTGRGQRIDVPMFETMIPYVLGDHFYGRKFKPAQGDFGYPRLLAAERRPYKTQDGYLCCTMYNDRHWKAFLEIVGQGALWHGDPRFSSMSQRTTHAAALCEFVKAELQRKTTAEWQRLLQAADIPVFPVHSFESLMQDAHLQDIGYFRDVEHPTLGTFLETATPSEWHGTPPKGYRLPPGRGEHSAEVLAEAGYAEDEIQALFAAGVTS